MFLGKADAARTKPSINHSFNTAAGIKFTAGAGLFQRGRGFAAEVVRN